MEMLSCCISLEVWQCVESPNNKNHHLLQPVAMCSTLKCLSIGTPKTINFPFVSNGKLMVFRCPNIQAHYNEAVIYRNFGTPIVTEK